MATKSSASPHSTAADTPKAVDELMNSLDHSAKDSIQALRAVILEVHASIQEGVKWNAPSFRTTEYFATTNLRAKVGIGVVLHFGAKVRSVAAGPDSVDDPEKLLKWLAKDRAIVNFASVRDLQAKKVAFQAILKQWITHV